MGIKGFYRWFVNKYPKVIASVNQENGCDLEYDHLYVDMNEIIHHCFHPDTCVILPTTFEQVFGNIYAYIDLLFCLVKPRKLLYLAIDGVAPRTKLNQQRSRVFRYAKDNEIAVEEEKKLREKYERKGKKLLPVLDSQVSDSNVITPGTVFMSELSIALKSYISERLENDLGWKEIKVILSDSTVPGEGEHKIMSFIRTLRSLPGYDPNTRHCVFGQDCDLILLALATHEINFSIFKEEVDRDLKPVSEPTILTSIHNRSQSMLIAPQHYEFLHVWILREYLELDMQIVFPPDKFVFDFERIVDDFVFMCFFTGTDFLPPMPTLDVFEDGIGLVMHVYKNDFKNIGGYLVDMQRLNEPNSSFIDLERVEKFILSVGSSEEMVFKKRAHLKEIRHTRILSLVAAESRGAEVTKQSSEICKSEVQCPKKSTSVEQYEATNCCSNSTADLEDMVENTKEFKEELKNRVCEKSDTFRNGPLSLDKVKLGYAGWQKRYYEEKFSVDGLKEAEILRKELVKKYTEGLCWVLMYYFSDVPSWNWYYPYYYGLFASEFKGLAQVKVKFDKGFPFKPFDQLMAILPPKSAHALPKAYRDLMISSESDIVNFYPRDFEVDTNGKRFIWQGICKLPFMDQEKLLNATSQLETKIEMNEAKRNVETTDHLFWKVSNSCGEVMLDHIIQHSEKTDEFQKAVHDGEPIMCCNFKLAVPSFRAPRLVKGVLLPEKTVFENDIFEIQLWHEYIGRPRVTRKAAADEQVVHKNTGNSWSAAGRGKGQSYSNAPQNHQNLTRYGQSSSFSSEAKNWRHTTEIHNQHGSLRPSRSAPDSCKSSSFSSEAKTWRHTTESHNQHGSLRPSRSAPDSRKSSSFSSEAKTRRHTTEIHSRNAPDTRQNPSCQCQCLTWRRPSNANPSCSCVGTRNRSHFRTEERRRRTGSYGNNTYSDSSSRDPNRW